MSRYGLLYTLTALLMAGGLVTDAAAGPQADDRRAAASREAPSLPDYRYKGLDGEMHSLTDWKGKVVVLNFWATWCAPCQYEIKDFIRYQERYAEQGLQFIGIGIDEERKLKNVARTLGINYPVLVADPRRNGKMLAEWGNPSGMIPYTIIFDSSGKLSAAHKGVINERTFNRKILSLLTPAD